MAKGGGQEHAICPKTGFALRIAREIQLSWPAPTACRDFCQALALDCCK